jgi:hypothetical protein
MQHAVRLEQLPPEVKFPSHLSERIRFDAQRGELSFQGFMTKCTYDELIALSDSIDFHRALEELFVLSSEELSAPRESRFPAKPLVLVVATCCLALAALVAWTALHRSTASKEATPALQAIKMQAP